MSFMDYLDFGLAYTLSTALMLTLTGGMIAFCGPMDNRITLFNRKIFLRVYGSRMVGLWYDWSPIFAGIFGGIGVIYFLGWGVVGLFAMMLGVTWLGRLLLLEYHPERGYIPRRHHLTYENGCLTLHR
jgi:hypothetical protein